MDIVRENDNSKILKEFEDNLLKYSIIPTTLKYGYPI